MTNPNIPLSVQGLDTGNMINQATQQGLQNEMSTQQILRQHYDNLDAREKSRLSSTIAGAAQLKSFIDNNDLEGAHNFLIRRKASLQNRMGAGENVDTQETDAALDMLRTGRIDELKNGISGLMAAGQVYGILNGSDAPANVQEWQYYNSLSPQDQERYLTMKRSNQAVNLGGSQVVPNPANPGGTPLATFPVTPRPEELPEFRRDQTRAVEEAKLAAESSANANNTIGKAQNLLVSLEELKTSAANAPSGMISGGVTMAGNLAGFGTEAGKAQGDFQVKRAAAENAIRQAFRVVGSGATSDRDALPFIQMLPDANDSQPVKIAKTDAAIQAVKATTRALAANRNLPDPFANAGSGGKVRGFDPQTGSFLEIDRSDLEAAIAEGFQPQ